MIELIIQNIQSSRNQYKNPINKYPEFDLDYSNQIKNPHNIKFIEHDILNIRMKFKLRNFSKLQISTTKRTDTGEEAPAQRNVM
jgi:hypothetical protein